MKFLNKIISNETESYVKDNKIPLMIAFGGGFLLSMFIFKQKNPHVITYIMRGV